MAVIYSAIDGDWKAAAEDTWGLGIGVFPGAADTVIIRHAVVVTDAQAAAVAGVAAGGALTIAAGGVLDAGTGSGTASLGTISIEGALHLGGTHDFAADSVVGVTGSVVIEGTGEATLTTHGNTLPAITVNNAGATSFTLADALSVGGALTLTAGKLNTGANALSVGGNLTGTNVALAGTGPITIAGNISFVGGTQGHTGMWTVSGGTHSHSIGGTAYDRMFCLTIPVGETVTVATATCWLNALSLAGAITSSANLLYVYPLARTSNILDMTAVCSHNLILRTHAASTLALGNIWMAAGKTLTVTTFNTGSGNVIHNLAGFTGPTLVISRPSLGNTLKVNVGPISGDTAITLGGAGGEQGSISFGGSSHALASLARGAADAAADCKVSYDSSLLLLTGSINMVGLVAENLRGFVSGGTMSNFATVGLAEKVHCLNTTNGGGNTGEVDFDSASLSSMPLLGVG